MPFNAKKALLLPSIIIADAALDHDLYSVFDDDDLSPYFYGLNECRSDYEYQIEWFFVCCVVCCWMKFGWIKKHGSKFSLCLAVNGSIGGYESYSEFYYQISYYVML